MNKRKNADGGDVHVSSRAWVRRFGYAMRGVRVAVLQESNFAIYFLFTAATVAAGAWVGLSAERWCLAALAATVVVVAEMFNTAIERLARAITRETHPEIRDALDVASGAVLVASLGAAVVGGAVLLGPLLARFE